MEPIQLFTVFTLAMAAIHLTASSLACIQQRRDQEKFKNGASDPGEGMIVGARHAVALHPPQRDDWYVFFHCSALTGKGLLLAPPDLRKRPTTQATPQTRKQPPRMVARL